MSTKTYKDAGVNIDACDAWLASLAKRFPVIGGFAGVFPLGKFIAGMDKPCLVSSTDGVGTKVLVAKAAGDLSTIGIDCVAMVVNDLICCGARPLVFLDYLAVGKFDAQEADTIVSGLIEGCAQAGCNLVGGETAELPGLFKAGEFDVAGFGVGVVDGARVIDGSRIAPGDAVIGLASTGIHSNGLSLARSAMPEYATDPKVARQLLTPTKIYVSVVMEAVEHLSVKGIAHITGGGLPGNLCRALSKKVDAVLDPGQWDHPGIFDVIAKKGSVEPAEMYRTYNMGIGMCLVVDRADVRQALTLLKSAQPRLIGEIVEGSGVVRIKGVNA